MTRSNRILTGVGLGVLAALVIAGYFASPILALQGLTAAAKAGDKAPAGERRRLPGRAREPEEPAQGQHDAQVGRKTPSCATTRSPPSARCCWSAWSTRGGGAVETYATPDAIANMVATNEPPKNIGATPGGPIVEQPQPEVKKAKSDTEVHYGYVDLDHFRATYRDRKDGDQEPFGLVLERRGLFKWKLVKIELPGLG